MNRSTLALKSLGYHLSRLINNKATRSLVTYNLSATFAQILMMVYSLIAARSLGPKSYGLFAGIYSFVGLSSFFIHWGMDTYLLREGASGRDTSSLSGNILLLKAILGCVWAGALYFLLPLLRPDLIFPTLLLACMIDIWSDNSFNTQTASLNLQNRIPQVSVLILFSRGSRLLGMILLILFNKISPLIFAETRAITSILTLLLSTIILRPNYRFVSTITASSIFKKAIPYGLSEFLALVYLQADVSMVLLIGGQKSAGVYAPASSLVNALFVIPSASYFVILPILTRVLREEPEHFINTIKRVFFGFCGLGALLALVVGFAGPLIARLLLGEAFQTSGQLLTILSPILFLKSVGFACVSVLVSAGWQRSRLGPQLISAILNVLLNLLAIPRFGVTAVAWVYVISEAALCMGYLWSTRQWIIKHSRNQNPVENPFG